MNLFIVRRNLVKTALIITTAAVSILLLNSCSMGSQTAAVKNTVDQTGDQTANQTVNQTVDQAAKTEQQIPSVKASDKQNTASEQQAISQESRQNSEKLFEQGNVLYNSGDYEGAIKILKQAVQADPENYQAYNVLGVSQAFLGLYGEADKNIDQAIKLNPGFANATFNKAISLKLQKKYDEAIKYFDMTIKLNPNDVWSHYGKATIYSEREDVKSCVASLKTALERDPGVKEAVKEEHEFDPVRNDPEFQKLMK